MKKLFSALLAAALLFAFTSCGASGVSNTAADYSNSTQTGEVTAMDGTKVTVQLGELTENEVPEAPAGDTGAAAPAQGSDSSTTNSQSGTQTPAESTGETAAQAPGVPRPVGKPPAVPRRKVRPQVAVPYSQQAIRLRPLTLRMPPLPAK